MFEQSSYTESGGQSSPQPKEISTEFINGVGQKGVSDDEYTDPTEESFRTEEETQDGVEWALDESRLPSRRNVSAGGRREEQQRQNVKKEENNADASVEGDDNEGNACRLRSFCCSGRCCCFLLLLVVLAAVLLGVGLTKWRDQTEQVIAEYCPSCTKYIPPPSLFGSTSEPTPSPTSSPTSSVHAYLLDILEPYKHVSFLLDQGTVQGRVFEHLRREEEINAANMDEMRNSREILQRYALLCLHYSTNGENWKERRGWRREREEGRDIVSDEGPGVGADANDEHEGTSAEIAPSYVHECDFFGVTCTDNVVEVTGMPEPLAYADTANYGGRVLRRLESGVETYSLRAVTSIELANNNLDGSVLPELCFLSETIQVLDFSDNGDRLSGRIPACLGSFASLKRIKMDDNAFSGALPPGLLEQPNLERVDIFRNKLSGTIQEIGSPDGRPVVLRRLGLGDNMLVGPIPSSIGRATELELLDLSQNQLKDSLPDEITNLTKLTILTLFGNNFQGVVADDFKYLINLVRLELHDNDFTGVSSSVCDLIEDGSLLEYTADCDEVQCGCCTDCFED